jgi:hypothetical protein
VSKSKARLTKASGSAVSELWPWVAAGLIGPVISWTILLSANFTLLPWLDRLAVIHPVWPLRALATFAPSLFAGFVVMGVMVVANVAIFTGLGFLFRGLSAKPLALRWGATVAAYAVVYVLIAIAGFKASAWATARLIH